MNTATPTASAPQFITVPMTGLQICRNLVLARVPGEAHDAILKAAKQLADKNAPANPLVGLLRSHIACDPALDNDAGWIACARGDPAFFRVRRSGLHLVIDLVVDTRSGAGKTVGNRIPCAVDVGRFLRSHPQALAEFLVEDNFKPRNVPGSLVMDFGNTATAVIFAPAATPPQEARPIPFQNPFDPHYRDRDPRDASILKSTTFVLWVPESERAEPWLVMGKRADELIAVTEPLITSLYAPKKYMRHWSEDMKAQEPATQCCGLVGQRGGLLPTFEMVRLVLKQVMEMAVATLANPTYAATAPVIYPQITNVLLTYPLTWRDEDKELFRATVDQASREMFVQEEQVRANFKVELIASEPEAVAAYALWQVFFQFLYLGQHGVNLKVPSLVSSLLGNTEGTQQLRLLVVDIGGGSTDIALVELDWQVPEDDLAVNVYYRVTESLRFNRAGDRISHIMATAILKYIEDKYGVREPLEFFNGSPTFPDKYKREAVSRITALVEEAKAQLARNGRPWKLGQPDKEGKADDNEEALKRDFQQVLLQAPVNDSYTNRYLEISLNVLQRWLEMDQQGPQTRGKPGFMDIFHYLDGLNQSLKPRNKQPHLVILSGRTSRLPFIKTMTARHLQMPMHRVITLAELLPASLKGPDHANMDKLAVVYGAHLIRHGQPIRFVRQEEIKQRVFRRFLGTVVDTPMGLRLNRLLAQPDEVIAGDAKRVTVQVGPGATLQLGHAFRKDAGVEVIAELSNHDLRSERSVEIELRDDYTVTMKGTASTRDVILTRAVSGGTDVIVDNFNDTGKIDREPDGFLHAIVSSNEREWMKE